MVKPMIQRTAIEDMVEIAFHFPFEGGIQMNLNKLMIEQLFDNRGIAVLGHPLITMIEIIVIVVKAQRQPLENAGRKLGRMNSPLLQSITLEESFVEFFTDKA